MVLQDPACQSAFAAMVKEATRQGPHGPQLDTALISGPWDFDLGRIGVPVYIWQGEEDRNATVEMAQYVADAIPGSHLHLYPHDGHISTLAGHAEEVLGELVAPSKASVGTPKQVAIGSV